MVLRGFCLLALRIQCKPSTETTTTTSSPLMSMMDKNIPVPVAAQQPKGQYASIDEALGAQAAPQPQVGQFGSIEEALKHLNGG